MGAFIGYLCSDEYRRYMAPILAEFTGTFLFTASVALIAAGGTANAAMDALAIGVTLSILVFHGLGISGAQYNPAITIGVAITNSTFGMTRLIYYILAQLLGGALGGLMAINLITEERTVPEIAVGFSQPKAFFLELFFAFLLVFTVIRTNEKRDGYGFYVGAVQFVGTMATLGLTDSTFNPALAVGLYAGSNHLAKLDDTPDFWLFVFAPILGGILAAFYSAVLTNLQGGSSAEADTSSDEYTSDNEAATPGQVQLAYTPGALAVLNQGAPAAVPAPQPAYTQPVPANYGY